MRKEEKNNDVDDDENNGEDDGTEKEATNNSNLSDEEIIRRVLWGILNQLLHLFISHQFAKFISIELSNRFYYRALYKIGKINRIIIHYTPSRTM